MFIARLLFAIALAVGVSSLVLYLITGNRQYLIFLSRAFLLGLFMLVVLGLGMVVGRLFGLLL